MGYTKKVDYLSGYENALDKNLYPIFYDCLLEKLIITDRSW